MVSNEYKSDRFSGAASIPFESKPFFSIVVPCFNTKTEWMEYLLKSLIKQEMNDDIELILSDDCSADLDYLEVVDKYNEILHIRHTKTKEDILHCPGNNRENGSKLATGEWITFVDHDDGIPEKALQKVKKAILDNNEKEIVCGNFLEIDCKDGSVKKQMIRTSNWMHAKYYNLENFWKKNNIHFPNMKTHEDIHVSSQVNCILARENRQCPLYIDEWCYYWRNWNESFSRTKYPGAGFVEYFYEDYLNSTGYVYINDYIKHMDDKSAENLSTHLILCIDVLLFGYFYLQAFRYAIPHTYNPRNEYLLKQYLYTFLKLFNATREDVWHLVGNYTDHWYNDVRETATNGVGDFIEAESFRDFLFR